MDINVWDFLTFRNVLAAILLLPLLTMLACAPFHYALSKNAREWLTLFGFLGFVANIVLAIECCYRIINSVIAYAVEKPKLVFDHKLNTLVYYQEPYSYKYIVFAVIFFGVSFLTWQLVNKVSPWELKGKKNSEVTSLDLNK
jgi:hypothetical protein